jgi:hypothetical protein
MISLEDFKYASFERKCDVVTSHSDYLMMRKLGNCKVYLYHSADFFIEVYYSPTYKKVLMINAFDNSDGLVPYTESVSLDDLNLKSSI